MWLLDFILSLVALLLWLNWCSLGFAAVAARPSISIIGTLKRAEPVPPKRWRYLAGLVVLLYFRSVVYGQLGQALHWSPQLSLGVTTLSFRSDLAYHLLLFSFLSFVRMFAVFYAGLFLLSVVNQRLSDTDPIQKLIRVHLGRLEGLPPWLKLALPVAVGALLWWALCPLFYRLALVPPVPTATQSFEQGAIIGLAAAVTWAYLLFVIFFAQLLSTYIYFGDSPVWTFVEATGRRLALVPLHLGKADLAPALGLALCWLGAVYGLRGLGWIYARLPL